MATAPQWLGTARMPQDLATAGWNVALLGPKGTLAEKSRHVQKIGHLPDTATPLQWVFAFAATVRATQPRLILPCDDTSFRLMRMLVVAPPRNLQPALHAELSALIVDSLGDPLHYRESIDKTMISQAAEAAGVAVPAYAIVANPGEARAFADRAGWWPLVLKRSHSSAGDGVAICADPASLTREFARLSGNAGLDLDDTDNGRLLAQAWLGGMTRYFAGTAWRGRLLCGHAVDKLEGEANGAASVVRYFDSAELWDSAARLAAAFGASGIFAPEFLVEERTGRTFLVEINRRITPGTHRGATFGMSSGAALLAAVEGKALPIRARLDDGEERICVSFPHEWLRDPESRYLRQYPVDVPWDEPELIEAMLAMRKK